MARSGKTITFATDLLPNEDGEYKLGDTNKNWKIYGAIQGGTDGQVLKSDGTKSSWQDEYKIEIIDISG